VPALQGGVQITIPTMQSFNGIPASRPSMQSFNQFPQFKFDLKQFNQSFLTISEAPLSTISSLIIIIDHFDISIQ
jgi:hypothetical protein